MAEMRDMKILYATQGTGNGHLCRALDIIPALQKKVDVDILISGIQADIDLPYEVKYRLKGLSFIFGKKGGVDLWKTFARNNTKRFIREIRELPLAKYDLVINDFEPVSAWAALLKGIPCFALSHQSAVLDKLAPQPLKKDYFGRFVLKKYAPSKFKFGFHFHQINENIFTPVIRKQVRDLQISEKDHYTVYLPSYSDEKLIKILGRLPKVEWQVFSKHNKKAQQFQNINIQPVNNKLFLNSVASSKGVLCGAGFETPAEVLFLKKKLMVVPMRNQYEQHCNAAALENLGVAVIKNLKAKQATRIQEWINTDKPVEIDFPDITDQIIDLILSKYYELYPQENVLPNELEIS